MSHNSPIPADAARRSSYGTRSRRWLTESDDASLAGDEGGLVPYRRLALRVIRQAMHDVVGAGSEDDRRTARHFLEGSALLSLWCDLAQLDVPRVISSARRALAFRRRNQAAMALLLPVEGGGEPNRQSARRGKGISVEAGGSDR